MFTYKIVVLPTVFLVTPFCNHADHAEPPFEITDQICKIRQIVKFSKLTQA